MSAAEVGAQNAIILVVGQTTRARLVRAAVGLAVPRHSRSGEPVQFGHVGQCDLTGVRWPHGRRIEVEVKVGKGRLLPSQRVWRDLMCAHGALHIVAVLAAELTPVQMRDRAEQTERGGLTVVHDSAHQLAAMVAAAIEGGE